MSFDRDELSLRIARTGPVARVVVAETGGSAPREAGAAMLVWPGGQSGTIGGGTLEFEAARRARALIADGADRLDRQALGPSLGQCCGGRVTLLTEIWDTRRLGAIAGETVARPLPGGPSDMPMRVKRLIARARDRGAPVAPQTVDGWMIEPVTRPVRAVWIHGAGHVGRAIVGVLSPLPGIEITWLDTADDRFPRDIPAGVTKLVAADPARAIAHAPAHAEHLILTYSHALDLEICHALLGHGFGFAGLIGSNTKWVRFRKRLGDLGHGAAQIGRITCPIGDPTLGKHPQAIAVGVAAGLLRASATERSEKGATG